MFRALPTLLIRDARSRQRRSALVLSFPPSEFWLSPDTFPSSPLPFPQGIAMETEFAVQCWDAIPLDGTTPVFFTSFHMSEFILVAAADWESPRFSFLFR